MGFVVYPYSASDLLKDSGFDIKWVLLLLTIAGVVMTELGVITVKTAYREAGPDVRTSDLEEDGGGADKLVYRGYASHRKRSAQNDVHPRWRPAVDVEVAAAKDNAITTLDTEGAEMTTARQRRGLSETDERTPERRQQQASRRQRRDAKWDQDEVKANGRRRVGWSHTELTLIHICFHGFITQVVCIIFTYLRNDMHILTEILLMTGNTVIAVAAVAMLTVSLLHHQQVGEASPQDAAALLGDVETDTIVVVVLLILLVVTMIADIGVNVRRMQLDADNRPMLD